MSKKRTAQERIDEYVASAPESIRNIMRKALAGKDGGRANAVKAKCLACCNWERKEITHCTVVVCPLHPWRPYQGKADTDDEQDTDGSAVQQ